MRLRFVRMSNAIARLERQISGHVSFSDIIGRSAAMKEALARAEAAAASKLPVWIEGEAGVGKELLARAIHGSGERAGKPFVSVDCKALPDDGGGDPVRPGKTAGRSNCILCWANYAKPKAGRCCSSNRALKGSELQTAVAGSAWNKRRCGTDLPMSVMRLHHAYRAARGGGRRIQPYALPAACGDIVIAMPPLSQRREDIALLAKHFVAIYAASENKSMIGLTGQALEHLAAMSWPGNVRQLANLLWQAVMICNQDLLDAGNIRLMQQWQPVYYNNYGDNYAASPVLFDEPGA